MIPKLRINPQITKDDNLKVIITEECKDGNWVPIKASLNMKEALEHATSYITQGSKKENTQPI